MWNWFEKEAIEEIAKLALKRKIGARGLRSIIESVMTDLIRWSAFYGEGIGSCCNQRIYWR